MFAGSPTWSADGTRVAFYEMTIDQAFDARFGSFVPTPVSQIASVDVITGAHVELTAGAGLKVAPQFVHDEVAYLIESRKPHGPVVHQTWIRRPRKDAQSRLVAGRQSRRLSETRFSAAAAESAILQQERSTIRAGVVEPVPGLLSQWETGHDNGLQWRRPRVSLGHGRRWRARHADLR